MNFNINKSEQLFDLLSRLSDFDYVVNHVDDFTAQSRNDLPIESTYLFTGLPSLVVLFGELNKIFPDKKFNLIAHSYMKKTMEVINSKGIDNLSLAVGMCGIAFAIQSLKGETSNYSNLQFSINSYILDGCRQILEKGTNFFELLNEEKYDLMFGLVGIINYMLLFSDNIIIENITKSLLSLLINLVKDKGIAGFSVYLSNSSLPQHSKVGKYINLGISHGIAAFLILLIKSFKSGIILNYHEEIIDKISSWLIEQKRYDNSKFLFWPSAIYFDCEDNEYYRDAWCYGTPGVAYSLLLAGEFLKNNRIIIIAIEGMKHSLIRQRSIISPTFCQGWAGLYYLSKKFYFYTHEKYFKEANNIIKNNILSFYNTKNPFGFKNIEYINGNKRSFNNINLLSGVSGVLLTIFANIDSIESGVWEKIFLMDA